MSRTIYIIGNDGSGKSTYARRFETRAAGRGVAVIRRHYYTSVVRRLLRGAVERAAGVRRRKIATTPPSDRQSPSPSQPSKSPASTPRPQAGGMKRSAALAFLWVYQTAMGLEMRCRDWFSGPGVLLMDRSYVDDLVSISQTMRIAIPAGLLRWSARLFPARRMVYLTAGSDVELRRIVDLDLSPEVHRRKGELYRELINRLREAHAPVREVNTAGRQADVPAAASSEKEL